MGYLTVRRFTTIAVCVTFVMTLRIGLGTIVYWKNK
jgi:hypothetical protein